MQFNRDKSWILHLGGNNELFTCRMQKLRVDEGSTLRKRLRLSSDHRVNESQRRQVVVKHDKQGGLDRTVTSETQKPAFLLCLVFQRQLDARVQLWPQLIQKVAKNRRESRVRRTGWSLADMICRERRSKWGWLKEEDLGQDRNSSEIWKRLMQTEWE